MASVSCRLSTWHTSHSWLLDTASPAALVRSRCARGSSCAVSRSRVFWVLSFSKSHTCIPLQCGNP